MASGGKDVSRGLRAAVEKVQAYLADEFAALRAMYLGSDEEYAQAAARAESHLHSEPGSPLTLGFGRPTGPAGGVSDRERSHAQRYRERPLFLMSSHQRGDETVYRAIVGERDDPEGVMYAESLHLAPIDGELKIVGRAGANPFGDELAWDAIGGDQLEGAGPPLEVAKFQRPAEPKSAANYDAQEPAG
jgi:hypothetical protein